MCVLFFFFFFYLRHWHHLTHFHFDSSISTILLMLYFEQMNFIQVFFNGFPLDSYQNSQLFVKYPRNSKRTMININVWNQEKNVMFVKICSHIHTLLTMNWRTVSIFGWFVYGFQYTHTSITCQFVLESVHFGRVLCSLFQSFLVLKSTMKRWMEMYSDFHENVWLRKKAKKINEPKKYFFSFLQ